MLLTGISVNNFVQFIITPVFRCTFLKHSDIVSEMFDLDTYIANALDVFAKGRTM